MDKSLNLLLSGYITGKSKVIKKKSQELQIQYFQGAHSSEYLLMEIFDGDMSEVDIDESKFGFY